MRLEDAAAVRALWRRQRELERVLADRLEIEPVKAEALRELEEVTEYLRTSPWRSRGGAERCARAVAVAIKRLLARLAAAVDAEGRPDAVLHAFARHLHEHLLVPSGRGVRAIEQLPFPASTRAVPHLRDCPLFLCNRRLSIGSRLRKYLLRPSSRIGQIPA